MYFAMEHSERIYGNDFLPQLLERLHEKFNGSNTTTDVFIKPKAVSGRAKGELVS